MKNGELLSGSSHHQSSSNLHYSCNCSFRSAGCFPHCGFIFCCPHCLLCSLWGPHTHKCTHTSTDLPPPPQSLLLWEFQAHVSEAGRQQIPIPLWPVSPHSHGFLMGLKQAEWGGEGGGKEGGGGGGERKES